MLKYAKYIQTNIHVTLPLDVSLPVLSTSDPTWLYIGNKRDVFHTKYLRYVFSDEEVIGKKQRMSLCWKKSGELQFYQHYPMSPSYIKKFRINSSRGKETFFLVNMSLCYCLGIFSIFLCWLSCFWIEDFFFLSVRRNAFLTGAWWHCWGSSLCRFITEHKSLCCP